MLTQMLNAMNTVFQPKQMTAPPAQVQPKTNVENPFVSPFITVAAKKNEFNSNNQPVPGGYFAGYHNNKKNIVGKKLFIAV